MAKLYLCIDTQYDFQEGGNLGVNGGKKCGDLQAEYLSKHKDEYGIVIATVDWHPITHCSFKDNGGIWPPHCVQHSHGAAIYQPLLDVLTECHNFVTLTKGCDEDHEEYSIFKNEESKQKLISLIKACDIDEIHVGGLAYDYCVASTCKDGLRYLPNVKFKVFKEFCPAIADGTANEFTEFINHSERIELV